MIKFEQDFLRARVLLGTWFRKNRYEITYQENLLKLRWREIIGDDLAKRTEPMKLRDGVLTLGVVNHVWLNELSFVKAELLEKIQAHWTDPELLPIQQLKLVYHPEISEDVRRELPRINRVRHTSRDYSDAALDPETHSAIEYTVSIISDETLRDAIKRARIAFHKNRTYAKR